MYQKGLKIDFFWRTWREPHFPIYIWPRIFLMLPIRTYEWIFWQEQEEHWKNVAQSIRAEITYLAQSLLANRWAARSSKSAKTLKYPPSSCARCKNCWSGMTRKSADLPLAAEQISAAKVSSRLHTVLAQPPNWKPPGQQRSSICFWVEIYFGLFQK